MFAKRFFYVCAGLLCLAPASQPIALHARAQSPPEPVFLASGSYGGRNGYLAVTATGGLFFFTYGQASLGWQHLADLATAGDPVVDVLSGFDADGHGGLFTLSRGGQVNFWSEGHGGEWRHHSSVGGSAPATSLGPGDHGDGHTGMFAALENGDIYLYSDGHGSAWLYHSNVFPGAPTPVQQSTWGSVKARYR